MQAFLTSWPGQVLMMVIGGALGPLLGAPAAWAMRQASAATATAQAPQPSITQTGTGNVGQQGAGSAAATAPYATATSTTVTQTTYIQNASVQHEDPAESFIVGIFALACAVALLVSSLKLGAPLGRGVLALTIGAVLGTVALSIGAWHRSTRLNRFYLALIMMVPIPGITSVWQANNELRSGRDTLQHARRIASIHRWSDPFGTWGKLTLTERWLAGGFTISLISLVLLVATLALGGRRLFIDIRGARIADSAPIRPTGRPALLVSAFLFSALAVLGTQAWSLRHLMHLVR